VNQKVDSTAGWMMGPWLLAVIETREAAAVRVTSGGGA